MSDILMNNSLVKSLLEEIRRLNDILSEKNEKSELSKQSCIFLYGFNSKSKVAPDIYRKYVAFINNISAVLAEFGISVNNNGYSYIVDAVMLIIDQNSLDIKLRDDIYPHIKQKYSLNSSATVEHSIRNAINSAWKRCLVSNTANRMKSYEKKPSNKKFLYTVTQDVCSRMCTDLIPLAD